MNNNNNNARDSLSNEIPLTFPDMHKQPLTKASGGTMVTSNSMIGSMNDTANESMDMLYTSSKTKNNSSQSTFSSPYRMEDIIQIMPESKANTMINDSLFVPSKLALKGSLQNTPAVFNEMNSFLVSDAATVALQACTKVFSDFDFDVSLTTIDDLNFIITGIAFITDIGIGFKICIFRDMNGTRFEICRCRGDSISFHNFYECMKQRLAKCLKVIPDGSFIESPVDSNEFFFPPLPSFSMSSLDSLEFYADMDINGYSDQDLNRFAQDLNEDSYQLETLAEVFALDEKVIGEHNMLVEAVIGCCQSNDIAVQRLALKIMGKLEIVVNVESQCEMILKYIKK